MRFRPVRQWIGAPSAPDTSPFAAAACVLGVAGPARARRHGMAVRAA
jgi:hypothetical protein